MRVIFIICFFVNSLGSFSQLIPPLKNYKAIEYNAHAQNWSVTQSINSRMYFGNTAGLLEFNGAAWKKWTLDDNTTVRTVYAKGSRIYSGSYGDFGYWTSDTCDDLKYYSLNHLIKPDLIKNEEIWNIIGVGDMLYFQSFSLMLAYDGRSVKILNPPGTFMFAQRIKNQMWIPIIGDAIYLLKDDKFISLPGTEFFKNMTITGMIEDAHSQKVLITTSKNGIYTYDDGKIDVWNSELNNLFIRSQVNKILSSQNGELIIGTIRAGVIVVNANGQIKYRIDTSNGLQNNTVLALFEDKSGDIWIGLDNGISHLTMNDGLLFYKDITGRLGTIYAIAKSKNQFYIGSNQGVYHYENVRQIGITTGKFELIEGTQGQVWQLMDLDGQLLCGHNDGTFLIKDGKAIKISNITGGWANIRLAENDGCLLQGNYTGLAIFKKVGARWRFSHKIKGYNLPVNALVQYRENSFWITGPNLPLKRIQVNEGLDSVISIKIYDKNTGLATNRKIEIQYFNQKLHVFDGSKHLVYDDVSDSFIKDNLFPSEDQDFVFRPLGDNIYAMISKSSCELIKSHDTLKLPLALNNEKYNFVRLSDGSYGLCLSDGYAILSAQYRSKHYNDAPQIYKLAGANKVYCNLDTKSKPGSFSFSDNDVSVFFDYTDYENSGEIEYQLFSDKKLLRKGTTYSPLYLSNLSPGNFHLRLSSDSQISETDFIIKSPWFLSAIAYVCYALFVLIILLGFRKFYRIKYERDHAKLQQEHDRLLNEKMMQLENQQLRDENIDKSKELANVAIQLKQKNELLLEIKDELNEIRKTGDQKLSDKEFQVITKQIKDNITLDQDKQLFNAHFDKVHEIFLMKLKKAYPQLTQDDLKLAAYLRMNLSSKEMAALFNLSIRGIENKRYRLRKKMDLDTDINLTEYFLLFE